MAVIAVVDDEDDDNGEYSDGDGQFGQFEPTGRPALQTADFEQRTGKRHTKPPGWGLDVGLITSPHKNTLV
jgi:hypothetical protein